MGKSSLIPSTHSIQFGFNSTSHGNLGVNVSKERHLPLTTNRDSILVSKQRSGAFLPNHRQNSVLFPSQNPLYLLASHRLYPLTQSITPIPISRSRRFSMHLVPPSSFSRNSPTLKTLILPSTFSQKEKPRHPIPHSPRIVLGLYRQKANLYGENKLYPRLE